MGFLTDAAAGTTRDQGRLAKQVRCCEFYEFTAGDDLGLLPKGGKVAPVTGDEVVGSGSVGALQEFVVVRVVGDFQPVGWDDDVALVLDELKELQA